MANCSFLQLGRVPEHMEFVPPEAVVPQTHDPPSNGAVVLYPLHIEYSSDGDAQISEELAPGLQTHSVPPEQIGLVELHPACGSASMDPVSAQREHDPFSLHIISEPQVPGLVPSPFAPST